MNASENEKRVDVYVRLKTTCVTGSGKRSDISDYVMDLHVEIQGEYFVEASKGGGRVIELGSLHASRIKLGKALYDGISPYDLFDESQEIMECAEAILDPDLNEFQEAVQEQLPEAFFEGDLLLIHSLILNPFARGQKAGASALYRFVSDYEDGCSLVAIQPMPLQFTQVYRSAERRAEFGLDSFSTDEEEGKRKLERLYTNLGFHRVQDIPFLLRCPCYQEDVPCDTVLSDLIRLPADVLNSQPDVNQTTEN
jgi:hypothetical protein